MTEMAEIKILIADDHAIFRSALRKLLEREPGLEVVGEAGNGREVLRQVAKLHPHIVLLDLKMPEQSGLEILRGLASVAPEVHTILLTAAIKRGQVVEALRLGACGVVMKDAAVEMLCKSIRSVMAGEYWVAHAGISDLVNALRAASSPAQEAPKGNGYGLTRRESDVLLAVVDGCTNRDVAEKLLISEQTVKHHLTNIFEKVGVSNRLELALFAMSHHLLLDQEPA